MIEACPQVWLCKEAVCCSDNCRETGETVLIDPVLDTVERDLALLQSLGLQLTYTLETHVHADHLTGAHRLRALTGCRVAYPAMDELPCADIGVEEGRPLQVGRVAIHPLFTPGHPADAVQR
jgi:glyoxylase-like metal-dependent hydrolase (beta-lactamase superfamily II)